MKKEFCDNCGKETEEHITFYERHYGLIGELFFGSKWKIFCSKKCLFEYLKVEAKN